MQKHIISVIIPLYNKAAHIERTIHCVLGQTFSDFELVIVDDGSTDDSLAIVQNIKDERIKVISQKNCGRSIARNNGITASETDFVALLDADDEWEIDHIETLVRLIKNFPDAGAWGTAYDSVNQDGKKQKGVFIGLPESPWEGIIPRYFYSAAVGQNPLCASSVAISKRVLSDIGMFPIEHSVGEDIYLWGKIALKYPIVFSWHGRAIYRQDARNRTNVSWNGHPFVELLSDQISQYKMDASLKRDLNAYKCKLEFLYAANLILRGYMKKARSLFKSIEVPVDREFRVLKFNYYFWRILSFFPKWFAMRYAMKIRNLLIEVILRKK